MCVCVYTHFLVHTMSCMHIYVHCLATQCVYKFGWQIVVGCVRESTHVANDNNDYGHLTLIRVDLAVYVCMHVFAVA